MLSQGLNYLKLDSSYTRNSSDEQEEFLGKSSKMEQGTNYCKLKK